MSGKLGQHSGQGILSKQTTKDWRLIMTRYPKIRVKLIGTNGNAFAILGRVQAALKKAKVEEHDLFLKEAMSGDYDHLLATCMEWVTVY